jgi:hypothetical protein
MYFTAEVYFSTSWGAYLLFSSAYALLAAVAKRVSLPRSSSGGPFGCKSMLPNHPFVWSSVLVVAR